MADKPSKKNTGVSAKSDLAGTFGPPKNIDPETNKVEVKQGPSPK